MVSRIVPRLSEIQCGHRRLGYSAARSILSLREPVTAIFAGSDQISRGIYEELYPSGLSVPDDIGVAGFNDIDAALLHPPPASVAEFPEELGTHLEVLRAQPY
jgi:LacI family transcriptional regulator